MATPAKSNNAPSSGSSSSSSSSSGSEEQAVNTLTQTKVTRARLPIPDDEYDVTRCFLNAKGNVPVLIVSGHGGRWPLNAVPKRTAPHANTVRDDNANHLVDELLQSLKRHSNDSFSPYYIEALCHRKYCDLNRSESEACEHPLAQRYHQRYHGLIDEYLKDIHARFPNQRAVLLDIHGQAWRKDTILRGTKDGATVPRLLAEVGRDAIVGPNGLFGQLEQRGYKVFPPCSMPIGPDSAEPEAKNFNGGWTVADAVQLEIGYNFRASKESRAAFANDFGPAILAWYKAYLSDKKVVKKDGL